MKIYVASSWKNSDRHDEVIKILRENGHEVYDYRKDGAFHWSEISSRYKKWKITNFVDALEHPLAVKAFHQDLKHMKWADVCILILPSGRSSHLEAGWFVGQGKSLFILTKDEGEPAELTYKLADIITVNIDDILDVLR